MINRKWLMFSPEEYIEEAEEWYVKDGLLLHLDGIYNDSYTEQTHADNPTLWKDISGNDNHFIMYNTTTTDNSFMFNGTSAYGRNNFGFTNNALDSVLTGVKNRTIEVVCKLNNATGAQTIFLGRGTLTPVESGGAGLWYRASSNGMKISTLDGSLSAPYKTTNPTAINHYCAKYSSSHYTSYSFYQNTNVCGKATAAGNIANPTYITIGARHYNSAASYFLNGEIYAIRVYDRELTAEERLHNYNLDARRFGLTPVETIEEVTE